jgi:MFS family permease
MNAAPHEPGDLGHTSWPLLLAVLIIGEITSAFELGMMFGALSTIMREFRDPVGAGWLITAFLLVGAASAALCSRFGDIYGRQRVAVVLLLLAALGSVVSAFAPDLKLMIVGRALQGLSTALLPLCVGLVREHLPLKRVGLGIGLLAAMATSSAGVGIMLGGWAVDSFGWRSVFWISAGHAVFAALCFALLLPRSRTQPLTGKLDVLGGLLFAPAVATLLLAITRLKGPLNDPLTLGLAAFGAITLVYWARHEWTHPRPMLDVRLFTQRQIGMTMLMAALCGLGTSQQMLVILQLAQQPAWTGIGLGLTATAAAAVNLPSILAGLVGASWSGWVAGRLGGKFAALWGTLIILSGWLLLLAWHDTVFALLLATLVIAFGGAIMYAACVFLVTEVSPRERTSEINGQLAVLRAISYAAGTVFATLLLTSTTVSDETRGRGFLPAPEAYQATFYYVIGCAFLCLLVVATLPARRLQKVSVPEQATV